jgi:hypothetical protein
MKIKYVGLKPFEDAFSNETGVTWGPGVEHDIPDDELCARMLKHPDVFAFAGDSVKEPETAIDVPEFEQVATPEGDKGPQGPQFSMQTPGGVLVLDGLDKATLKELAKEAGLSVGNSGAEKIRAALVEAFPVTA